MNSPDADAREIWHNHCRLDTVAMSMRDKMAWRYGFKQIRVCANLTSGGAFKPPLDENYAWTVAWL
ncbi:MAG: hypothetical protein VCB07_02025 [Gammaproteobacteria bacterium]